MESFDSGDALNNEDNACPKCQFPKMKDWDELTHDQKFLAERLPLSAEFTSRERKKHRFCERCWFEAPKNARFA